MSRHLCRKLLFKHHALDDSTLRVEKTLDLDWLTLHNCGISKPWNIEYKTCRRCGEEICLGGYEDEERSFDYRAYLTRKEYQELKERSTR